MDKIIIAIMCLFLVGCSWPDEIQTRCVNGKYYVKHFINGQYVLQENVECLDEKDI